MAILDGRRVLLVEDELVLAWSLGDMIKELGGTVAATAARVKTALEFIGRTEIDLAILDINLNDERVDPVAEKLSGRGVPIIFATGYGQAGVGAKFKNWPTINKPYNKKELVGAVETALSKGRA